MVVVQGNPLNRSRIATVACVPLTSNLTWEDAPGNTLLRAKATGLPKDSVANASRIIAIDRAFLVERVRRLGRKPLAQILDGIDVALRPVNGQRNGGVAWLGTPERGRRWLSAALAGALTAACSGSIGGGPGPTVGGTVIAVPGDQGAGADANLRRQVRGELARLFRAQQRYHAIHDRYADDVFVLRGDEAGAYEPARGVRVRITSAGADGFGSIATRAHVECALRVGDAPPPRPYATAKEVAVCRDEGPVAHRSRSQTLPRGTTHSTG